MNVKVTKMVFWMGLLVLLLGQSSTNLMVASGGVVPDPPGSTGTTTIVS